MSGFFVKPCNADDQVGVKANTPIDGDGTSNRPLEVNVPALAGLLVDGKTTTVVNGKIMANGGNGQIINNTVAAASDNTLNGDGTAAAPLGVNVNALVDGSTIRVENGKLQAVPQPATATQTDATTIIGNGTAAAPLAVNVNALADGNTIRVENGKLHAIPQPATATQTDATMSGDGTAGRPLGVNVATLVDGNTTIVDGGKIKVNFPEDKQGVTDAELQGTNIVLKNSAGGVVRSLNISDLIPAAASDRFLKNVRYDQVNQKFVFTVGDNKGSEHDQTIEVPAGDLIPVTVGDGITGKGTSTEPLKVRHDNTLTIKNGELSVVPQDKDCTQVISIDAFARDGKKGFECFIADYRTTIGLPMVFPSTASEQDATTQVYPDRRNIYSGYKIGTADGSIIYVYENTTDGRAIGWSRTYQGTTSSKWVRETALIPPTGGGLAAVNAQAPIVGAGTTGAPLRLDQSVLAANLADGTTLQAVNGKLKVLGQQAAPAGDIAKIGAKVTGIGESATAQGVYLGNGLYHVTGTTPVTGFANTGNVAVNTTAAGTPVFTPLAKAPVKAPLVGQIVNSKQGYEVSGLTAGLSDVRYTGTAPEGVPTPVYPALPVAFRAKPASYAATTEVADAYVAGVKKEDAAKLTANADYSFYVRIPATAPYGVHKGDNVPVPPPPPPPPPVDPVPPPVEKPQPGVAGADTKFSFTNAVVGKEWATSDDGKVVIYTDDSIARKGKNWTGLVVDSDKGKAVRTQIADEAKGYIGVFADMDAFNITPDKKVTVFLPFRIDGIGNRVIGQVVAGLNGNDATAAGKASFVINHRAADGNFDVPATGRAGRTINGKTPDANTRLVKNQWYIATVEFTGETVTAFRLGAPAGGNGGLSATYGPGMRVVENISDADKQAYLNQLAAEYGVQLQP